MSWHYQSTLMGITAYSPEPGVLLISKVDPKTGESLGRLALKSGNDITFLLSVLVAYEHQAGKA